MSLPLWGLVLTFVANVAVGVALVLSSYKLMEQRILLGAVGGLVLGAVVVYGEATLGRQLFELTFTQKRLIITVAGVAAALGITGTLVSVEPELGVSK